MVVDSSVIVKWVLPEPDSDAARRLMGAWLIAPALWRFEAAAVVAKWVKDGRLSIERAPFRLATMMAAPVDTSDTADDLPAALALANRLRHPLYDCLYLAVALRAGVELVTADTEFVRAVRRAPDLASSVLSLDEA